MTLGDRMVAEVLVEVKAKQIDKTFSYQIPASLEKDIEVGKRVLVPFGSRMVEGFVLAKDEKQVNFSLKEISASIDEETILNQELLELGKYISKKTMCSLISSYQTMLPSALKAKNGYTVAKKEASYLSVLDFSYVPKTQKQKEVMDIIGTKEVEKNEYKMYPNIDIYEYEIIEGKENIWNQEICLKD